MLTTIDKSGGRVRKMFAEIAGRYDLLNHLLSLNIDRYWRWRTVRLVAVDPQSNAPILDVCTGTGDLAFGYYRATGGKLPIVAADFCAEMLDVAHKKSARKGIGDQIEFVEADTQHLPFEDDRFQIVSVAFGLRNVSDTDLGLREMVRVCCSGGRVAILEFSRPTKQPIKMVYGLYFRHLLPRIGQMLARNRQEAYDYLPASVAEFPCGEALATRMQDAGLRTVAIHPLTMGIATLYIGTKP